MKIALVEIRNFRKLKSCRVELNDKQTVFVGANNSGKTSAMDAMILFLKKTRRRDIATTDFTLSNWKKIDDIGTKWISCGEEETPNLALSLWLPILPSIDIWLEVADSEIHYVSHLIPTLSWNGGLLGVRLSFEPRDIEELYKEYKKSYTAAQKTIAAAVANNENLQPPQLWPRSMNEFLKERLHSHFRVNAYLLDPSKQVNPIDGVAQPQELPENSTPLEGEPFECLFKIDIINAQRGFSDAKTSDAPSSGNTIGNLTTQLRSYYDKHLNPSTLPEVEDIEALSAIEEAREKFDERLSKSFKTAISELECLGYPGFSDPQIRLTSKVNPLDGLNHDSAVQFDVIQAADGESPLSLPEKYNGLGYQNLVSMVFSLIRFRDEWMRKGKAGKSLEDEDSIIEPLHLVLIEEPEAHLHAQVQQVFIKKAYGVLRNHENLMGAAKFNTQMIVSTHSSHIAHETDFSCLRYFRRKPAETNKHVPCASVVNLSNTFGSGDDTAKFVTRYLKTTHCDLFFADAAIIVEGPAERMLVPHFIKHKYKSLDSLYVTVLEIGGSHAHRLKPLIEELGLITLIISDIDTIAETGTAKKLPVRNKKYRTGNDTLKSWHPVKTDFDELLDCPNPNKITNNGLVRVAYQYSLNISFPEGQPVKEAIPYTFEDALVLTNISLFKGMTGTKGLIKKMQDAISKESLAEACNDMFLALTDGKKAEMALDLLYLQDPDTLIPPAYISEGLEWLQNELGKKTVDFVSTEEHMDRGIE